MKIIAVYDGSGPKYHRVLLPCYGLQQYGYEVKVVSSIEEKDLNGVDIVLFNRIIPGISIEKLVHLRGKYGFKLVCDLDDHWILGKDHVLYHDYNNYRITDKIIEHIKQSDIITVTHDRLRNEVLPLNKNCYILPNAIPKVAQFDIKRELSEQIRLFWAGGITHEKDLELLRRPLQLVKNKDVRLVIAGYVKNNPVWHRMAKIYTNDSSYNTDVFESLPVHLYYHHYCQCDISLIPLIDNEFNRHKSNLKILEAANIAAPVIVSRVHPYLDFPDHLVNYVDSHTPFYYQINRLLKDEKLRTDQGLSLQQYVNEHYNFYKISLERKHIFDAATQQRSSGKVQAETSGMDK